VSEPVAPDSGFPRVTTRPLPRCRFICGPNGSSRRDAGEDSIEHEEPLSWDELRLLVADWRRSPHFCYGVDLYNYAYWWEAHHAWEPLWRGCPKTDPLHQALQGLIRVSAAHLQRHMGHARGARTLVDRAGKSFAASGPEFSVLLGIDFRAWFHQQVVPYFERPETTAYPFLRPGLSCEPQPARR
jgi:hypothetical protein